MNRIEKPREDQDFVAFLKVIYKSFKLNVDWFLRTQASDMFENTFRWKGRTLTYCLPSGMDDYPRAPILTDAEAHLDLQVWMIVSTRTLSHIASLVDEDKDAVFYATKAQDLTKSMEDNFWDKERGLYDDIYTVKDIKKFVGHTGYLNFWPLFLNTMDPSTDRFTTMMNKLIDKSFGLWTDYGIASLSKKDPYYKMADNYWTSPIWLNINFLIVKSLYGYSTNVDVEPILRAKIKTAYEELRQNLIEMIVS